MREYSLVILINRDVASLGSASSCCVLLTCDMLYVMSLETPWSSILLYATVH